MNLNLKIGNFRPFPCLVDKLHAFYQNQAFSIHLFESDPSAAEFSRFYPSLRSRMRLNPKISGVEQHGLKVILIDSFVRRKRTKLNFVRYLTSFDDLIKISPLK